MPPPSLSLFHINPSMSNPEKPSFSKTCFIPVSFPIHHHRTSFMPANRTTLPTILPRINRVQQHKPIPRHIQPTMAIPIVPLIRGMVCPSIFTIILLQHARNPHRLPALLPKLWPVTRSRLQPKRAVPVSLLASFRLGRLVQRLQTHPPLSTEQEILDEARQYLKHDIASLKDLRDLEANLEDLETGGSLTRRLHTALTLANLLWLVSIAGLGVTFWPTLQVLFGTVLASASEWFMRVVLPLLIRLHHIGVFEVVSYVVCTLLVAQAARYLQNFGVGVPGSYVALTAFVGSTLAFWYTMHLHFDGYISLTNPIDGTMGAEGLNGLLWAIFQICVLVPLGAVHESELLGFIGVVAIMDLLNNTMKGFAYEFVGFNMSETFDRLTISSGILVGIFVAAGRLLGGAKYRWMKAFHLGVMILGNSGYFTGLLVRASKLYRDGAIHLFAQIHMVVSLAVAIGLGNLFRIVSLSSTGIVFGSLYVVEKLSEMAWGHWGVVAWFGVFGLLYAVAGYVRTHAELLKNLFDGRGLLSRGEEKD